MNVTYSPQQQTAADQVREWFESPSRKPVFRLFGYAGTGKTTLAKQLVDQLGRVRFATFTGKAALVLQSKGCYPSTTIHSLIYLPKEKSAERLRTLRAKLEGETDMDRRRELEAEIAAEDANMKRPSFSLNQASDLNGGTDLLVLDEVSMVNANMGCDLESFGVPILALGDPGQLPPIKGSGYFTDVEPDFMLTEIHRQAKGDPIIDLATIVREGGVPEYGEYGSSRVVAQGGTTPDELLSFDQVIVGTHKKRKRVNSAVRKVLGYEDHLPVPGDKLICTRNDKNTGLMNGSQWQVHACEVIDEDIMWLTLSEYGSDSSYTFEVSAWRHPFEDREDEIAHYEIREHQGFEFGYGITCHKAQGSQWDNVCVLDEGHVFRDMAARWRYTAITRAAKAVTIVR